ncbi:substrate-binding domain-containing protein [Nocardia amamiensis]|uniref:substrate-binding domain-containing protein n=1 Tax=Nocardia amamiensis TaxID=404578 RepID=UPI0012F502D0
MGIAADSVLTDSFGGGYAAAEHLLRIGHRRIGVIGASASLYTVSGRLRGYYAAFEAHQLRFDHGLIRLDVEGAAEAKVVADELLDLADPRPRFFTLNSQFTFGAIRALWWWRASSSPRSPGSAP